MSAERTPEAAPAPDPCVVCGHELWCHQVPRPAAASWHCNGHGPVCVRFASTIAAKNAAEDAQPLIAAGLADRVAPDPRISGLSEYIPCPNPVTYSTDRSGAVIEEHWKGSISALSNPAPVEPCRASWAEFVCAAAAGHKGKHHTYDGEHTWYQVVVPGTFDVSDTPTFAEGVEVPSNGYRGRPAPLHRLGEVHRALRALASQIAFGSSKPGRTVGDWRPAYSSAQGRSELIDKILRHALALAAGELLDEDGRPHAAAVIADTAFLIELEGGS